MSVQDIRARVSDVPNTHNMAMELGSGRIVLKWGEGLTAYTAVADATASDADLEAAVRNAVKLPPVALIEDRPASVPSASTTAPAATAAKPSGHPADTVGALDRVMQDHVRMMGDIHAAQLKILESTLARQRDSVATGVGTMAAQIDRQTDDFNAMMARWTNGGN